MLKDADISPDGLYRYSLERWWGGVGVVFVMLNPSVADADTDDPTIRRCVGFARSWGYSGVVVVNLFAYRETHPKRLLEAYQAGVDVVGVGNNDSILAAVGTPSSSRFSDRRMVVLAWGGINPRLRWRVREVEHLLIKAAGVKMHCLGCTAGGEPRHPLMLPANLRPLPVQVRGRDVRYPRCAK